MGKGTRIDFRKITDRIPRGWVTPVVVGLFITVLAVIAVVKPSIFSPNRTDSLGSFDQLITVKATYGRDCPSPCTLQVLAPLPNTLTGQTPGYSNSPAITRLNQSGTNATVARLQGELQFRVQ